MTIAEMETPKSKIPASPIPLPDQSVFDRDNVLSSSDKRKTVHSGISKPQCPSPPSKSPPMSRLGFSRNHLYTPVAQSIDAGLDDNFHTPAPSQRLKRKPDTLNMNERALSSEGMNQFTNLGSVGKGSFAEVYAVKSNSDDQQQYAIKKSRKQYRGEQDRDRAIREYRLGKLCSESPNRNCLQYYTAWEEKGFLHIQTELCKETLKDFISKNDPVPEDKIWKFLLDISLGLHHIHSNGLIHLDIKPSNILIGFDEEESLKIGDFGLAVPVDSWRPGSDMEGDFTYMAPELLANQMIDGPTMVGPAADVFSLGLTIFEMATNIPEMPKGGDEWALLRSGKYIISNVKNAPNRTGELCKLVKRMMEPEPRRRITIDQILKHRKVQRLLNKIKASPPTSMDIEAENLEEQFERAELEQKQREQFRRESLEGDLGGKNLLHDDDEISMAPPQFAPKRLSFELD